MGVAPGPCESWCGLVREKKREVQGPGLGKKNQAGGDEVLLAGNGQWSFKAGLSMAHILVHVLT